MENIQYTGNELVNYNNGSLSVNGIAEDHVIPYDNYYPWFETYYHRCYPSIQIVSEKSKVEQAFKIVGKMLEKKIIKELNVQKFIELVNDIAGLL